MPRDLAIMHHLLHVYLFARSAQHLFFYLKKTKKTPPSCAFSAPCLTSSCLSFFLSALRLLCGSTECECDRKECPFPHISCFLSLSAFANKTLSYPSFSRGGSVRDRVRKFTEPAAVSTEKRSVQRSIHRATNSSANTVSASLPAPAHSEPRDHSQDISSSLPSFSLCTSSDRGVNPDQSRCAVGGPQSTTENVRSASCSSEEIETPRGTASSDTQEVQEDPQSNMKAFLTIEIKDGRTSATQASSSSSTSMSGAMPRILTGSAAQRAGRILSCLSAGMMICAFCNTL